MTFAQEFEREVGGELEEPEKLFKTFKGVDGLVSLKSISSVTGNKNEQGTYAHHLLAHTIPSIEYCWAAE